MAAYSFQITLAAEADDHSHAVQQATELSVLLANVGYGHVSTVVIDNVADVVAEFAVGGEL